MPSATGRAVSPATEQGCRPSHRTRLPGPSPSLLPSEAQVTPRRMTPSYPARKSSLSLARPSLPRSSTNPSLTTGGPRISARQPVNNANTSSYTPIGSPKRLLVLNESSTSNTQPITPQRQLMQPLGPPLPRSQTFNDTIWRAGGHNRGCTTSGSPTKKSNGQHPTDRSEPHLMERRGQGRQGKDEMGVPKQLINDLELDRERLNKNRDAGLLKKTNMEEDPRIQWKAERIKGCLKRSTTVDFASMLGSTLPSPDKNHISGQEANWNEQRSEEADTIRLVHHAQPSFYWLGRMSALLDMQRTANHRQVLSQAGHRSSLESHESAEFRRFGQAVAELYSCCCSDEARRSLKGFTEKYASTWLRAEGDGRLRKPVIQQGESTETFLDSGTSPFKPQVESSKRKGTLGRRLNSSGHLNDQALGLISSPSSGTLNEKQAHGEGRRQDSGSKEVFKTMFTNVRRMGRSLTGSEGSMKSSAVV